MDENLALTLRPKSLKEVLGQDQVLQALHTKMTTRPARALMFHGPSGVGKTTLARIVALSEQLERKRWGNPTSADWQNFASYTIQEINASNVNGVDDMRQIVEFIKFAPLPPSRKRVIVLDEAQLLTNQAQNVLLKPFEDAPDHVVWIVCTTDPRKIIAPLKQRCASATYELRTLNTADMITLLKRGAEALELDVKQFPLKPLGVALQRADIGNPRLVLSALEQYANGIDPESAVIGGDVEVDTLRICRAATKGDWPAVRAEIEKMTAGEARWVRASAAGWFKSCLLRSKSTEEARRFAENISTLTAPAPLEDGLLIGWLTATLWAVCRRMKS